MTTQDTLKIKAEVHSDDHNIEVEFDAVPWFQQATDDEILDLAGCGWGGDYPADAVARFFSDSNSVGDALNQDIAGLFDYLEIIKNDPFKEDQSGFECHVDEASAMKWLETNRPALFQQLSQGVAYV